MTRPEYTPKARNDLRAIIKSSTRMFGRLQARRYADRIEQAGLELATQLRKGKSFDDEHPEHLRLKAGSHYLVYLVDRAGRTRVIRILHSRMDLARHL